MGHRSRPPTSGPMMKPTSRRSIASSFGWSPPARSGSTGDSPMARLSGSRCTTASGGGCCLRERSGRGAHNLASIVARMNSTPFRLFSKNGITAVPSWKSNETQVITSVRPPCTRGGRLASKLWPPSIRAPPMFMDAPSPIVIDAPSPSEMEAPPPCTRSSLLSRRTWGVRR